MYTHLDYIQFYKNDDVIKYISDNLSVIGRYARHTGVRLSFHPGQFCVLASDKPRVVNSSITEFEYHTDIAKFMGYCQKFQDIKINVHLSGQGGVEGFTSSFNRLSPEARSCITIENDECSCSIDDCLKVSHLCPIVLDIHHQWVKTGEYIQSNDDRCKKVLDSWKNVRPVIHYSVSPQHTEVDKDILPDMTTLLRSYSKQKLRAHSDLYWNSACNKWALSFLNDFDIMCESKGKNLSSFELHNYAMLNKNSLQI
jgi:UV DNA damage repair endonuclease